MHTEKNIRYASSFFFYFALSKFLNMKDLSGYGLSCKMDHMFMMGEEDYLGSCRQFSQNFKGRSGPLVVEIDEGIVYKKGKRLAIGDEFLKGGQAKGRVEF